MSKSDFDLHLKYPWQQVLLEAFVEFDPKQLPVRISTAQQVISDRMCEVSPLDLEERLALTDAMRSLRILTPKVA